MIIKRIKLKNFISHADTDIEFPLGVTAIVGPNGAGKTAIVDAVIFALFGEKVRGDKIQDIIRRGADSAEVELVFEESKEYVVRWIRGKRKVDVSFSRSDGGFIADTKSEVLNEISKTIGIDKESAMHSIFIRQGEIADLIDADPRRRKNLLGKLIGLDTLEKAWRNMKDVIDHFSDTEYELKTKISGIESRLEEKENYRDKLEDDIKKLKDEVSSLHNKFQSIKKLLKEAEDNLKEWDKKEKKYNDLNLKLTEVQGNINAINRKIKELNKKLKESKEARAKLKKLEPELKKIPLLEGYIEKYSVFTKLLGDEENLNRDLSRISSLKEEISESIELCKDYVEYVEIKEMDEVTEDLSQIAKNLTKISTQIKNIINQINKMRKEVDALKFKALKILPEATIESRDAVLHNLINEKKTLENEISKLENSKGGVKRRISDIKKSLKMLGEADVCPVCKRKLTPEHREKVKNEFQRELADLEDTLKRIGKDIKKKESDREKLDKAIAIIQKLEVERIGNLEEEMEDKINEVKELHVKLQVNIDKLSYLENNFKASIKEINDNKQDIERELNDIIKELGYKPEDPEKDLKNLRKKKEKYDRLKWIAEQYEELNQELNNAQDELNSLVEGKNQILKDIKSLEYDKDKHNSIKKKHNEVFSEFKETETKIKEKKKLVIQLEGDLKDEQSEIKILRKDFEEYKSKYESFEKFIVKLTSIRNLFSRDGIQKILRRRVAPLMSEYAKNYIENFNLDITDILINEDFDITVIKRDGEISIKSVSGGEKVAIAIALRLAIAKALAGKVSLVIMDEPTIYLDEERRKELIEIMRTFRKGVTIPQMIIITHHRELEDVADTVYSVKKTNSVSNVIPVI